MTLEAKQTARIKTKNEVSRKTFDVCQKIRCEQPAYLFWKLQSKMLKLNQRLHRLQLQNTLR